MFSKLRPNKIYRNISSDIVERDLDVDADMWQYEDRDVYRGTVDPAHLADKLNVYWLYDDNLKRVGLAEHESDAPEVFRALWFHENPFATLYQDTNWKQIGTLWSRLSNEAYQDYVDGIDIHDAALQSGIVFMTPERLIERPCYYECEECGKKTWMATNNCPKASACVLNTSDSCILFLDDDYIVYDLTKKQADDDDVQEQTGQPAEQADHPECSQLAYPPPASVSASTRQ